MAKKHYSVRLSEWLIEQLKIAAEKRNRSVNNLIETAILESLELNGGRTSNLPDDVKKDFRKGKKRKKPDHVENDEDFTIEIEDNIEEHFKD